MEERDAPSAEALAGKRGGGIHRQPEREEEVARAPRTRALRFPCLITGVPHAATTSALIVETL